MFDIQQAHAEPEPEPKVPRLTCNPHPVANCPWGSTFVKSYNYIGFVCSPYRMISLLILASVATGPTRLYTIIPILIISDRFRAMWRVRCNYHANRPSGGGDDNACLISINDALDTILTSTKYYLHIYQSII